jgi:NlpC/P60 family protein
LVLAVPEANSDHAAAAMTELPVGVAVFITSLIGLVMMASIGIIGGSAASPTAQQELPRTTGPLSIGGRHLHRAALVGAGRHRQGRDESRPAAGTGGDVGGQLRRSGRAHADRGGRQGRSPVTSRLRLQPRRLVCDQGARHDVAAIAIQFAYRQLGKPYVWGAGDLQPGDLVFGAKNLSDPSTIYHVGMYIGAGNMIVAPYTGAVVRIQPMIRNDCIGAVRPTAAA